MKEQFRRVILSATLALVIVYYFVRLFSVLYVFPAQTSIKSRPAIEQPHLKSELKRHIRHEIKSSETSNDRRW
jgi:hypothetical protein